MHAWPINLPEGYAVLHLASSTPVGALFGVPVELQLLRHLPAAIPEAWPGWGLADCEADSAAGLAAGSAADLALPAMAAPEAHA